MINLLLGAPGGGKSYEAVVFHILTALGKGRKVITNLPVVIPEFEKIDPTYPDLIEKRQLAMPIRGTWEPTRISGAYALNEDGATKQPAKGARVFGGVWDYYDEWKHPETGQGPLYVIDECHLPMPKGKTELAVEEWYSLHRHFNADVLLITQSYGKLSIDIRDLVQTVYRVRKNIALGSTGSYTRKVQDGLRGEIVNTTIRKYHAQYFKLYKSHTQGGAATEANASDVRSIWMNWTFLGAGGCLVIFIAMVASGHFKAPWTPPKPPSTTASKTASAAKQPREEISAPQQSSSASQAMQVTQTLTKEDAAEEPYANRGIHLTGYMEMNGHRLWTFLMSQNGQGVASITERELTAAGYVWTGDSQCSGTLQFRSVRRTVLCDAPQVGPNIQGAQGGHKG